MLFTPLLTGALETSLNNLLFRDRSMKAARQRPAGKVLRIELEELASPLVLVFSELRVDVLGQSEDSADCTVRSRIPALLKLRDRQQLPVLMRSGELTVEGDIQVVQQLVGLLDLAEWDPAEWLAPYIGDIAACALRRRWEKAPVVESRLYAPAAGHGGGVDGRVASGAGAAGSGVVQRGS